MRTATISIAAVVVALSAGAVGDSMAQDDGLFDFTPGGNPYEVLPHGVFATADGCGNLSRFFGILEERPPDFLVYSPSGITGENFKCLFQDDAKSVTPEWGDPQPTWTVTGKCEGWDLAPSGTAEFTIKQMSDDELEIARKLEQIVFTEDFGTFVRCPKAG
jgi:hypothetical protein